MPVPKNPKELQAFLETFLETIDILEEDLTPEIAAQNELLDELQQRRDALEAEERKLDVRIRATTNQQRKLGKLREILKKV